MENNTLKQELVSWMKSIFFALIVAFLVRAFIFSPYIVDGASMEPTLHDKEKIFVNKFNSIDDFKRGDIVIIKGQEKNYVKRIIGFPGEEIEMISDELYINGKIVKETYLSENLKYATKNGSRLTGDFGPLTVPDGHLFVMGDNRLYSMDSRNGLGYIKIDKIVGTSEFVYFPFKNFRNIK
ncbi:signal peptidase I [Bacillus sp. REN3]|uniref:signal peptidase I n=1 Tax=Bacillus sp. REN3 TaxID=2802440 RepID=UPI001AEDBB6F|nr:signal peptidase I [Bacillus sp. REN3]